jgi:hypothetical protein
MKVRILRRFVLLLVMCLAPSANAQNQVKDRAKLIEDAKREGKVLVYVSSNALREL